MSKSDIDPFKPGSPLEQALHSLSDAMVGSHGPAPGHKLRPGGRTASFEPPRSLRRSMAFPPRDSWIGSDPDRPKRSIGIELGRRPVGSPRQPYLERVPETSGPVRGSGPLPCA